LLSEGTSFDLGTLGGNESEALAVNRPGQVAGHSRVAGAPAKRAFFIPEPGRMVDLGTLGGATSIARDVNDRGEVVGFAETTAGRGLPVTRAFLRTPDGQMLDLGTLGGEHSAAVAVSEPVDGALWVVGHSHDAAARTRAVLWSVRLG